MDSSSINFQLFFLWGQVVLTAGAISLAAGAVDPAVNMLSEALMRGLQTSRRAPSDQSAPYTSSKTLIIPARKCALYQLKDPLLPEGSSVTIAEFMKTKVLKNY